jgi:predicted RNase H-like HicB family nuclease
MDIAMKFPVIIHKDPDSDYGVTVPDLPGCYTAGGTVEEALRNAVEAIQYHMEGMRRDGKHVPESGDIERLSREDQDSGGYLAYVEVTAS